MSLLPHVLWLFQPSTSLSLGLRGAIGHPTLLRNRLATVPMGLWTSPEPTLSGYFQGNKTWAEICRLSSAMSRVGSETIQLPEVLLPLPWAVKPSSETLSVKCRNGPMYQSFS